MKTPFLILILIVAGSTTFAKRAGPVEVKPISKNGHEFSFRIKNSSCQENEACALQVFLISKDVKTGAVKWDRELYQKLFDRKLEIDVQWVFPKSLSYNNKKQLVVTDERGSMYKVNSENGKLIQPLKSIIYPARRN
ncbi:MAG: hypothetical protein H7256_04290 [Bdellovibrio sp.]|nr:hypothetical protein [Bdellovibrio sp.]